jgi:hypothetical protein
MQARQYARIEQMTQRHACSRSAKSMPASESRRRFTARWCSPPAWRAADEEAKAIAAGRIRSGATDHREDGAKALERLGIVIPLQRFVPNGEIIVPVEAALDLA